jgi:hypothetical protein
MALPALLVALAVPANLLAQSRHGTIKGAAVAVIPAC